MMKDENDEKNADMREAAGAAAAAASIGVNENG
jgi:hypothetical protein